MAWNMNEIALYDLDKTITQKPTYAFFLLHAAWRHEKWRLLLFPAVLLTSLGYVLRLIDRARLKEVNQAIMLGSAIAPDRLAAICESFADATVAGNLFPQAVARLAVDRAKGRRIVLASASYAFYVLPIARRLGFEDVIATGSRRDADGNVLARIDGENCYGAAKLRMVEAWLAKHGSDRGAAHIRFHSDSESDLPVFEWCDERIAVNPTSKLRALAEARGWPIIAWG